VIGLVHDDHIGDLHHARLQRLDRVARARHQTENDRVGVVDDVDLGLADADRLDEDVVEPGCVHQQDRLEGRLGEASERAPVRHRADEHTLVEEVLREPDPVAEQRSRGERARGIDRQDRHAAPARACVAHERADQRALSDPRRAGEPDDARLAGARVDLADQLPATRLVVLHLADPARQRPAVPPEQPLGEGRLGVRWLGTGLHGGL
jgi:hypothetical protein